MRQLVRSLISIANVMVLTLLLSGVLAGLSPMQASAVLQERILSTGTADSSNAQGVKWRSVNFTTTQTGAATFRLSWTGSADMRFEVKQVSNSALIARNITASRTSPKTATGNLTSGVSYSVAIWSYSGVGTYSFSLTQDIPVTDTTPPSTPPNLTSPSQTPDSITLDWDASTDNVGVTGYRILRNGTQIATTTAANTTYTNTSLPELTSYDYSVRAVDAAGNLSASATVTASTTTNGPPDETPPSIPLNITFSDITHERVRVAWDYSTDDRAMAGYRLFRDGVQVGEPTATTYTDIGLLPETTYAYTVQAVDGAGNVSEPSEPASATTIAAPVVTDRPNVIIINLDDMRADSMADMPKVRQWMGDGGTNFPNGYVATPSCCPSRATLMSGRYVHNNGQYNQDNVGADLNLTIQRYLHDAGYFTGHSGKFLHWLNINTVAPHWDRWTYFKGGYNNVQMRFDNVTRTSQGYSTTITFDRGIEYLRSWETADDTKPFFVQLTPVAPHSPSTPEPKYATASVPALLQKPSHTETDRSDKPPFVSYINVNYASGNSTRTAMTRALYSVDDQVDRLMNELQALGELDNTMVIFTADNGYFFGEHGRNSKFLPYNEAVNVPFYIRWPGHVAAGATDNRRVSHIDITPTVLAAAGVTQNHVAIDGRDILSGYSRPHAYSEYYYDPANANYITTWSSIRNDQYLYVEYYNQTTTRGTVTFREYYDMVNDPYQMVNLLKNNTTADDPNVTQLSATLMQYRDCAGAACP